MMNGIQGRGVLGLLAAAVIVAGCGPAGTGTIRVSDVHPESYPTVQGLMRMAEALEERTNGELRMQIYHSAQLGRGETDTLQQTRDGDIQINRISAAPLEPYSDKIGVLAMPFLFRDAEHKWAVLEGEIGDELLESIGGGLVGLGWQDSGARSFYSTAPLEGPEDLQGLDIRVQDNEIMQAMVRALGATPQAVPYDELYSALQHGVVDAAENNPPSYYTSGHFNAAPHFILNEHVQIPEVIVASERWWSRLSEEDQEAVREAAQEQLAYQRERWAEMEEEAFEAVREAGVTIVEPDQAALDAFADAMAPVFDSHGGAFGDLISRIEAVE